MNEQAIHDRLERMEETGRQTQDTLLEIQKTLAKIAVLEERQLNYKETLAEFKGSVMRAHERIDAQDKHISTLSQLAHATELTATAASQAAAAASRAAENRVGGLTEKLWRFAEMVLMVVIGVVLAKAGIGP